MGVIDLILRFDGEKVCIVDRGNYVPIHFIVRDNDVIKGQEELVKLYKEDLSQVDILSILGLKQLTGCSGFRFEDVTYVSNLKLECEPAVLKNFFLALEQKYLKMKREGTNVGELNLASLKSIDRISENLGIQIMSDDLTREVFKCDEDTSSNLSDVFLAGVDGYLQTVVPKSSGCDVKKREPVTYFDKQLATEYVAQNFSTRVKDMIDILNNVKHKSILALGDGAGVCQVACRYLRKTCVSYDKSPVMCAIASEMNNNVSILSNDEALLKHEADKHGLCVVVSHVLDFDPGLVTKVLKLGYDLVVYEKVHLYRGLSLLKTVHDSLLCVRVSDLSFWKGNQMRLVGFRERKEEIFPYTDYYRSDKCYVFKETSLLPHIRYFAKLGFPHNLCYIGDNEAVIEYMDTMGVINRPVSSDMIYLCMHDFNPPLKKMMCYCVRLNKFFFDKIKLVSFPIKEMVYHNLVYVRKEPRVIYVSGQALSVVVNGIDAWFVFGAARFKRYPDENMKNYYGAVKLYVSDKKNIKRSKTISSPQFKKRRVDIIGSIRNMIIAQLRQGSLMLGHLINYLKQKYEADQVVQELTKMREEGLINTEGLYLSLKDAKTVV